MPTPSLSSIVPTGNETMKNGQPSVLGWAGKGINLAKEEAEEHPLIATAVVGLGSLWFLNDVAQDFAKSAPGASAPGIGSAWKVAAFGLALWAASGLTSGIFNHLGSGEIRPGTSAAQLERSPTTPNVSQAFANGAAPYQAQLPAPGQAPAGSPPPDVALPEGSPFASQPQPQPQPAG